MGRIVDGGQNRRARRGAAELEGQNRWSRIGGTE